MVNQVRPMNVHSETTRRQRLELSGASGNRIVADLYQADAQQRPLVLLVHGGGQTRHSWGGTARALASVGCAAVAYDQRGHGDSAWAADGAYGSEQFAADLLAIVGELRGRGLGRPVVVGASLGGIAGLIAAGELDPSAIRALVLVDITPQIRPDGVDRILSFMRAHAGEGFASPEEAADAIAAYLPHRPRPADLSGLAKNLRRDPDGRYRWHWDPRFLEARRDAVEHARTVQERLEKAARGLAVPVLLVRGRDSELVGEAEAKAFVDLVPHAEVADVSGARHMVAGDRNDRFGEAVVDFLKRL
jgi:pimeloyl-ACP methyl ester carboxylesterase